MIIGNDIQVMWNQCNKKKFIELGYLFTRYHDFFKVKLGDIPLNSSYKVDCKCDFCGKIFYRQYYLVSCLQKHSCGSKSCKSKLAKETNIERYGTECALQNDEVKKKTEETLMSKFGVRRVCDSQEIKDKRRSTFEKHYSDDNARKDLQKRKEDTREKTTGFRTPFHDLRIQNKAKQTCVDRYGIDNPWKTQDKYVIHDRQKKATEIRSRNQTVTSSKQQRYLCNVLEGMLNYPVDTFVVDVALVFDKIVVEYNGGGHYVYGEVDSIKESDKRKICILTELGWKVICFISRKDFLFYEKDVLDLFNKCKILLKHHNVIVIDTDEMTLKTDGVLMMLDYEKMHLKG